MRGTIKRWNDKRGFGFIHQDAGPDLFVHISAIHVEDLSPAEPFVGDVVEYEIAKGSDGRTHATSVYLKTGE